MLKALLEQNRILARVSPKLVERVKETLKKAPSLRRGGYDIEVHNDISAIYVHPKDDSQMELIYYILEKIRDKDKGVEVFEERGHITVLER